MENTFDPQVIYDAFSRHDMVVRRIDHFDKGDYAEIRIDLPGSSHLTPTQLLELSTRLKIIENREHLTIEIIHVDMVHHTLRINIYTEISPQNDSPSAPTAVTPENDGQ